MDHTIAIVGGGPAGLMLACELGLAGVDTVVIEQAEGRLTDENRRSHMLHARAVELLEQRGLMDQIRADAEAPVWPMIHFANFWLDLSKVLDQEHSIMVPQSLTVRVLEDRARELGADIRRGHQVTGLEQNESGVTIDVRADGGDYQIRCRYLVGCDGEKSTVRDLAGFDAPPSGTAWQGVLADFDELDAGWQSPNYPRGLFAVSPHPTETGWVRVMTMEFGIDAPGEDVPATIDELRTTALRITGREWELGQPSWLYRYANRTRLAERYRTGNVFLAGDAAHVHYFGAGHGASTSLHDAVNLGWKIAADVNGWAPAGLLDTYHDERHPVGHRVTMSTQAQLALQHPPERVASLRELFGELVRYEEVNQHLIRIVTDVRYPMESGTGDAHPLLGCRVPDFPLTTADGETRVAETLHPGRGVVLDLSGGALRLDGVSGWADRVDVVTAKPAPEIDAAALLVRPDGHVAWADASGADDEGLRVALTRWFGEPAGVRPAR
jgi:3-(3-hydroxy-phenyl)propionate hydroxylase